MAQTKNSGNSVLIDTYIRDLHPLLLKYEFCCQNGDIDCNQQRLKLVYKRFSPKVDDLVEVRLTVMPLPPIALHCIAYMPAIKDSDTFDLKLNWLANSKESMVKQFTDDFVLKLIQILSIGLNDLPDEVCAKIVSHLQYSSVVQLSQVNRFWYSLCGRDSFWKKLFRKTFTSDSYERALKQHKDWKTSFIREYILYKETERRRLRALARNFQPTALSWGRNKRSRSI